MPREYAADGTWAMPSTHGPCRTWPIDPRCGCFKGETELPTDGPPWPADFERSVEIATEYLWRKTAGRYGLCWQLVRPCPAPGPQMEPRGGVAWPDPHGTAPPSAGWARGGGLGPFPAYSDGDGGWTGLCGCDGGCGCRAQADMQLPGPVWQDLSRDYPHGRAYTLDLFIDGQRMPDEWFRVLDGGYLVPVGGWEWPRYQDLSRPAIPEPEHGPHDLVGTWGIRYWQGYPIPAAGIYAVSALACELWKACGGFGECKLPRGITDIQREGISYTLMDQNSDLLANMPEVNGWVQSVNPYGIKEQSYVVSPDLGRWHTESRMARLWPRPGGGRW